MKVVELVAQNARSICQLTRIRFKPDLNILVGPNAGGKSNILDILTTLLEHAVLPSYRVESGVDRNGAWSDIKRDRETSWSELLELCEGCDLERRLQITLSIDQRDVDRMGRIVEAREVLEEKLRSFRKKPIDNLAFLEHWNVPAIRAETPITVGMVGDTLQGPADGDERAVYDYLRNYDVLRLLSGEAGVADLDYLHLYFPPYRSPGSVPSRIRLSGDPEIVRPRGQTAATSRRPATPATDAVKELARRHRCLEAASADQGWKAAWDADAGVQSVGNFLSRMGYTMDLMALAPESNEYELRLMRGNEVSRLEWISSGERELTSLLFSTSVFNLSSGVLLIDEPELHLHPRWQELLLDLFRETATTDENQVIVATHSPRFIVPNTLESVTRVFLGPNARTSVAAVESEELPDFRARVHMVQSHKNERVFFADRVLLVEGPTDRLLFESLLAECGKTESTSVVVEVVDIGGTGNIDAYQQVLDALEVEWYLVTDTDYLYSHGPEQAKGWFVTSLAGVERNVLKNKRSNDRERLAKQIEVAIENGDLKLLEEVWTEIKARHVELRTDLSGHERAQMEQIIAELEGNGIHVLRHGEIEAYLPKKHTSLGSVVEMTGTGELQRWVAEQVQKHDPLALELNNIVATLTRALGEEVAEHPSIA